MRKIIIILATISFFIVPCTVLPQPRITIPDGFEEIKPPINKVFIAFRKKGGGYPTFVGTVEADNYGYPSIKEQILSDYRKVGIGDVLILSQREDTFLLQYSLNNVKLFSAVTVLKADNNSFIFTTTDIHNSVLDTHNKIVPSVENNKEKSYLYLLFLLLLAGTFIIRKAFRSDKS